MVITTVKTTSLFADPGHMALPASTCDAITQETLEYLAYLVDFDEKSLK